MKFDFNFIIECLVLIKNEEKLNFQHLISWKISKKKWNCLYLRLCMILSDAVYRKWCELRQTGALNATTEWNFWLCSLPDEKKFEFHLVLNYFFDWNRLLLDMRRENLSKLHYRERHRVRPYEPVWFHF